MKPKYNTPKSRIINCGTSLVTVITFCFSGSAMAVDNLWTGSVSTDYNVAGNWSLGRVPANPNGAATGDNFDDAVINVKAPNISTITIAEPAPRDFRVGQGAGADGRLDIISGSGTTGGGNWAFVGRGSGTGVLNLANTATTGGTLTGFGQGSGNFTCSGSRLYVGGSNDSVPPSGNGTFNMNTTGTLTIGNDLAVGSGTGAVGVMNVDSGTITTGGWNFIGKNENGSGGNGKLFMSGGTLTNTGRTYVGQSGSTGLLELSGTSSYKNISDQVLVVGEDPGSHGTVNVNSVGNLLQSSGELWLGQNDGSTGVLNVTAGAVTINNWLSVGRGGNGTVNQSGGSVTKTGGGSVSIANFANAVGAYNISAGLLDVQSGDLIVGEGGGGTAALLMSGTSQVKAPRVLVANGGTVVSTVSFNGGTLTTGTIDGTGGGTSNVSFNGTLIVATIDQPTFITGIDNATIGTGGLKVDSAGKTLTVPQIFSGSGPIFKSGAGTLNMPSLDASYAGNATITAGKLAFTTDAATLSGNLTVANNATLGVTQTVQDAQVAFTTATFGAAGPSSLDINLNNFPGNTAFAPVKINTVTLNGVVTLNITDALPATGSIPLVQYNSKNGTGSFALGTLPLGVVATLDTTTPGLVAINVTSVKLPRWDGTVNGLWDTTTQNWFDLVAASPTTYSDQSPPLFDDNATGTTNVILNTTVTPSLVTFSNSLLTYTLTGTGKITGTTGLTKTGTGSLTIGTTNDYTGITNLQGGTTSVASLTNGGIASPIGKATAASSNLVLAGGTLAYTGATTTIDRGFTVAAPNSGISTTNDLTLSGGVLSPGTGGLIKTGTGKVKLTNAGSNTIGNNVGQGLKVDGGTLEFNGTGGAQTNNVSGELWIGSTPNVAGNLVVDTATLITPSWIALGRGNGDSGTLSTLVATNSTISCNNFSTGYDNGLPSMSSEAVTLTNTSFTNSGVTQLSESTNTTTNMVLAGTSTYTTTNRLNMALGTGSVANITVQDSAALVKTGGWLSIGNSNNGIGTMTVKNSGTVTADNDFNVSDIGTSQGTLTLQDSAVVNSTGILWLAKNDGTTATINLNGGTLIAKQVNGNNSTGVGTFNFDGGILEAGTGANGSFMTGIDNVVIKAGGAKIDTNGQTVAINEVISDNATAGSLTKLGTGTLLMNSFNTYLGTTTVAAGTLGGTGLVAGAVKIAAGANINPGATTGTLSIGSLAFTGAGTVTIDIGANADTLAVTGELNLTNASLVLNGTPTLPTYIIASYGTLIGVFPTVTLPAGYSINYTYSGNQIAIVRPVSAYETFIGTFFPGETNAAIIGLGADPDNDGLTNLAEFALDGNPTSGVRSGKVVVKTANVGGTSTLTLTLPVRTGATFSGATGLNSAVIDGVTYRIEASYQLTTWNLPVTEVTGADKTAIETGLPALTTGYTYRTFQANGAISAHPADFIRAVIVSP